MKTIHLLIGVSALTLLLLMGVACTTPTQSASALPPGPTPVQAAAAPAPPSDQHDHAAEDNIVRIKPAEAIQQVKAGEAILVDVRDAGSYETMHAKGAINVTSQDIADGKLEKLPKDKHLIFYCT